MRKIPRRTIGRGFGLGASASASASAMTEFGGCVNGSWKLETLLSFQSNSGLNRVGRR